MKTPVILNLSPLKKYAMIEEKDEFIRENTTQEETESVKKVTVKEVLI